MPYHHAVLEETRAKTEQPVELTDGFWYVVFNKVVLEGSLSMFECLFHEQTVLGAEVKFSPFYHEVGDYLF